MAEIIIVDDDPSTAAFLIKALESDGHHATWVSRGWGTITLSMFRAELVLINQAYRHGSGWTLFNHLKKASGKLRVMLYLLDTCSLAGVRWVVEAVDEALACMRRETSPFTNIGRGRQSAILKQEGEL